MPQFTVTIPAPRRGGMRSMYVTSNPVLPGPNIFKGLAAFFAKSPTVLPGPDVFGSFARRSGLAAFRAIPAVPPTFPGPNIFVPFVRGGKNRSSNCNSCSGLSGKRRHGFRRGMGDDVTASLSSLEQAPTVSVPSDLSSTLFNQITPIAPSVSTPPFAITPSTNPSLDAFNQALTNSMAIPTTVGANLNPTQLAQLSNLVGAATTPQLAVASTQVGTSTLSTTLSGFFSTYGTYLLLGGAGIFAIALFTKKKGRR